MNIPRAYKTAIVIVLSLLSVGLLPGVAVVWAEVGPYASEVDFSLIDFIPSVQKEPPDVQYGAAGAGKIPAESDNSGVEIIPASAFSSTGELGNGSEHNDWFFDATDGIVRNLSANKICMVAPVFLPPGSTIDSFTIYVIDNYGPADVTFYLDRTSVIDGWTELGQVQSSGSSSTVQILNDSSIESSAGVNIVAQVAVNYYIDFCLPPNSGTSIRLNGARVDYTLASPPPASSVFVPITFGPQNPTTLFVTNNTGGSLTYTVLDTPEGDISCTIPAGAQDVACGTFSSGFYSWVAQTGCIPPPYVSGYDKKFSPPEIHLDPFFCRP